MKKELLCLPLALVLSACSKSDSSQTSSPTENTPSVQSLEDSGEVPKLDRSQDLEGPDADDNGIRDDIDNHIEIHFSDNAEVTAVAQAARANQAVLSVDLSDQTAIRQVNQRMSRATACIYSVFGAETASELPAIVSRDLEAITFNTAERLNRYKEFNSELDGSSWSLPERKTCG